MIYLARFLVASRTPWHIGSGAEADFDQPVERDAFGAYRLPGSAVSGVWRAWAARLAPELAEEAFGGLNLKKSSAIWGYDGRLLDFDGSFVDEKLRRGEQPLLKLGPYLRDHVRLDFQTGAAAKGGKFDEEYVPAGARFFLELKLDGWSGPPKTEILNLFLRLAALLKNGRMSFGGKSAEGFGQADCLAADIRRFDLTSDQGLRAWLNLSPGPAPLFAPGEGEPLALVEGEGRPAEDGISGTIKLPLRAAGPILIGGGEAPPEPARPEPATAPEPDLKFHQEPRFDYEKRAIVWRKVVPGSSLRGVLRHRVHKIAGLLAGPEQAEKIIDSIFGQAAGQETRPGKVWVADAPLPENAPTVTVQHVAIDRFTGGALDAALYDEAPVWRTGLTLELNCEVKNLTPVEAALWFSALLDVSQGLTPVGAGGARGQGFLKAEAEGQDLWNRLTSGLTWPGRGACADWPAALDQALADLA